ncbi:MAG TPA: DegT/DnrJ/EryC1/StrS family aminotransferase [Chthoniobacterales bacterium]|nr:DegT/DnrJ/EryC1/StrS family aminotransferase [Chthoniobacterales bacterium]
MRVPLLDLSEQYAALAEPIRAAVDEVLATQNFILGPKVEAFETAIAEYCDSPHAIGVSSGTDALLAVFTAMGLGPGDAVLTSDYSFFASGSCVSRVGATPVFIDIDPLTYNISPAALEAYLTGSCRLDDDGILRTPKGDRVRAIVPVHLYGLCCDMDAVLAIASRFKLEVIEDAAQALGAEYPLGHGKAKAGTIGEVGTFSFYPSKNLGAAGDAGMIVCRDEAFAKRVRVCRQHGMEPRYYHHFIGGNFRLDEIQAAILAVKLPHLDEWSAARRRVADIYGDEFRRLGLTERVTLPAEPYRARGLTNHHIYHQYVVRVPKRDALREHLTKKEIATAIYYPLALHEQECFRDLGYQGGDFPEAERAARETLALPIYPELSAEQQRYVTESIAEFF